jgi:hypothetical protein
MVVLIIFIFNYEWINYIIYVIMKSFENKLGKNGKIFWYWSIFNALKIPVNFTNCHQTVNLSILGKVKNNLQIVLSKSCLS